MKFRVFKEGDSSKSSWHNRLSQSSSLYLRLHAEQPIDWHPWGEEAFNKAKELNRPVLISVGYASCHWCHVMARESFSDLTVAGILNEHFIAIKVDREESPAVDAFCIQTLLQLQGDAGWPANIFVSPDCVPLMGGTYYPLYYQYGLPGFADVLRNVHSLWTRQSDHIFDTGRQVLQAFGTRIAEDTQVRFISAQWETERDSKYGGFGWGAKFPMVPRLDFILAHLHSAEWKTALHKHLDALDCGGIHDHVGGGFHRYAVDVDWAVPHYEKMLCDNALIARVLLRYHAVYNHPHFRAVGCDTLEWLLRVMKSENGLFAASVDAEDPQGEGYYYTWTQQEIRASLGSKAELFIKTYSVGEYGNTPIGRSTLIRQGHPSVMASARRTLQAVQAKRAPPRIDTKPITAWNAMTGLAFCMGYRLVRDARYLDAAIEIAEHLSSEANPLLPRVIGQAQIGTLEDQAWALELWLELYSCTADPKWLIAVRGLLPNVLSAFANPDYGLQLQHPSSGVPVPLLCADDTSEPAPLAIFLKVLEVAVMIGGLGVNGEQLDNIWKKTSVDISAATLCGAQSMRGQFTTVVATGVTQNKALWIHALGQWKPYCYVFPESAFPSELLIGKENHKPALWKCVGQVCSLPIEDITQPLFES